MGPSKIYKKTLNVFIEENKSGLRKKLDNIVKETKRLYKNLN